MVRKLKVAAGQIGAVHLDTPRKAVLDRMLALLDQAASLGTQLVVFPECAFTTFFPRHLITEPAELESYFESGDIVTSPNTAPLFARAKELGVDVYVGYAERTAEGKGYNTCVYFSATAGAVLAKYRKIHLPGSKEPFDRPGAVNQLEKRYFEPGDLGYHAFRAPGLDPKAVKDGDVADGSSTVGKGDPILGMLLCNDRRWAEAWRVLGLQGVELVLCGYNTASYAFDLWGTRRNMSFPEAEADVLFHHKLSMQGNSYMNSCFSVSAARAGHDDGLERHALIGGSCITNPEGYVIAEAKGIDDELVVAEIDLDECRQGKDNTFNFARHRRIEHYGIIATQTGVVEPELLKRS